VSLRLLSDDTLSDLITEALGTVEAHWHARKRAQGHQQPVPDKIMGPIREYKRRYMHRLGRKKKPPMEWVVEDREDKVYCYQKVKESEVVDLGETISSNKENSTHA
jgi:hypothetical protein